MIDKNKVSSQTPWVVLIDVAIVDPNTREVVDTLHIARNDENVVFGTDADGNPLVYQAGNFDFNIQQAQNQEPSVTITAQDQTRYIHSRMEAMAGGVFSNVTMTVVNTDRLDQPPEIQETFEILQASTKEYVVTFQLGSENLLAIQFPKSKQWKDRCAWRYKGYGCRYAGPAPTCDYTLDGANGCIVHQNALNFKGLPGLVALNI